MFGASAKFVDNPRGAGRWVDPLVLLVRNEAVLARVEVRLSNNEPIEVLIVQPDFDVAGFRIVSARDSVSPLRDRKSPVALVAED